MKKIVGQNISLVNFFVVEFLFLPHLAGMLQSDSPVWIHYFVDESTSDAVASTCHAMPLSALKHGWFGIIQSTLTVRSLINKLTVD